MGDTPTLGLLIASGIAASGRVTDGGDSGERVSVSVVTVDRVVFVESCAVVEVVSLADDTFTAVDCRLASTGKTGLEVVFGDITTVK